LSDPWNRLDYINNLWGIGVYMNTFYSMAREESRALIHAKGFERYQSRYYLDPNDVPQFIHEGADLVDIQDPRRRIYLQNKIRRRETARDMIRLKRRSLERTLKRRTFIRKRAAKKIQRETIRYLLTPDVLFENPNPGDNSIIRNRLGTLSAEEHYTRLQNIGFSAHVRQFGTQREGGGWGWGWGWGYRNGYSASRRRRRGCDWGYRNGYGGRGRGNHTIALQS